MSPEAGSTKLYVCENPRCSLGGPNPGHFTGGLTAEGMTILTGKPEESAEEGVDYGSGVCPNCGEPGTEEGSFHKSVEGDDDA
jgi:hypothetical protein